MVQLRDARKIADETGWLSRKPKSFRKLVLGATELQTRSAGENIYSLGDPPGGLHCLVDGYLNLTTTAGVFSPFLGFIARPGWWAGDVAAITQSERRAEIQARTDAILLFISAHKVEQIGEQEPYFWRWLGELSAGHLDNALLFAATAIQRDVRLQVLATLIRLASFDADSDVEIEIDCTQTDLAEMAGLTRNTVARVFKELGAEGLIAHGYGRIVYNPAGLRTALPTLSDIRSIGQN